MTGPPASSPGRVGPQQPPAAKEKQGLSQPPAAPSMQGQASWKWDGNGVAGQATEAGAIKDLTTTQATKRLYMCKGPQKAPLGELDYSKLLSQQAHVTWGQLLAILPEGKAYQLVTTARQLGEAKGLTAGQQAAVEEAVKLAAVQAALQTHRDCPAPENMFCPFVVIDRDPDTKKLIRNPEPMLHWGNVDTGSMVNIVYSGVLDTFPHLNQYHKKFEHVVKGVGDRVTRVIGKLVDVPISLGMEQGPGTLNKTTFYVLDCNTYHFILGLQLLAVIDGGVFCGSRRLEFTLRLQGERQKCTIPLATRAVARSSECYQVHAQ